MADFLDKLSDSELVDKAAQMFEAIKSSPADFGATAGQATELDAKTDSFSTDLTAHIAAQAAAKSQTQAKDASRDALEEIISIQPRYVFYERECQVKNEPVKQIVLLPFYK